MCGIIALRCYLMLCPVDTSVSAARSVELHFVMIRALRYYNSTATVQMVVKIYGYSACRQQQTWALRLLRRMGNQSVCETGVVSIDCGCGSRCQI